MDLEANNQVVGVHAPQKHPSLVNLNEDPLMSEVSPVSFQITQQQVLNQITRLFSSV